MFPKPTKKVKLKKPLNKVRKTSKSALKRKADKLFSELIRQKGFCILKGIDSVSCNGNMQCAHIIGRANHALRWDLKNALCLCAGHHIYYTSHPWEWQELIRTKFPGHYEYLNDKRLDVWDKDIEKVLMDLAPSK